MTEQVSIKIRGVQFIKSEAEECEEVELVTSGKYHCRDEQSYIKYEEVLEGTTETTSNLVKIKKHVLEIRKKGIIESHMIFEAGKKNFTSYKTAYGIIRMGITTTKLAIVEEQNRINIQIEYTLDVHEEYVANYRLTMNIESKKGATQTDI